MGQLPAASHQASSHWAAIPPIVARFAERLRQLPLGVWATIAEPPSDPGLLTATTGVSAGAMARARLRRVGDEMPSAVAQVRQRVHGLVAVTEGFVHPATAARMKKVALAAALALAARPYLRDDDFAQLYAPFAGVIPLDTLGDGERIVGAEGSRPGRTPLA